MRMGQSHYDVAITLIGAFSRYINRLEEGDFAKQETKSLLISLRECVNLRQMLSLVYCSIRWKPQSSHRLRSPKLAE